MTDKEKQRELIVEIMKADEQSGIYPAMKQTAVQWFALKVMYLKMNPKQAFEFIEWFDQAKEMEKEQMGDTWVDSRIADKGDDYIGKQKSFEQYYNETYK